MIKKSDYLNSIIADISGLIKIPSVYDAATVTDKTPYGKNVFRGYEWIREKALGDGFDVLEFDGRALAIRMHGNGTADRIDVVSHVDVVGPGSGWDDDPFSGKIESGYIYGRGSQDMKGSLMLTYYALKYIKENNIPCKRELRVVIGCDEERTMGDIKYYIEKAGEPAFAFTPDGKFPYSLGEKGALMWCIDGSMESVIEELDGGVQCNVVSPVATALVNDAEAYERYREMLSKGHYSGQVTIDGSRLRLSVHGKAAHASRPEDGENATVRLCELISLVSRDPLAETLYKCFKGYNGEGAGIGYDIEPMGKLTLNLGVLKIKDKRVTAEIDCRYPYGITSDVLTGKIQNALKPLDTYLKYDDRPTLADINSPYLKVLLNTYRDISGVRDAEPIISGGVTYGKVIGNCVAFGPMPEGEELLAHQANERLPLSKLASLFEIYTEAMIKLANL